MDAIETSVDAPLAETERAVREALAAEGFGILADIDIAAILEAKLGVQRPGLKILGACSPIIAHEALTQDPELALLLPCNVVLTALDASHTRVAIADPRVLLAMGSGDPSKLEPIAERATASLTRAIERLAH